MIEVGMYVRTSKGNIYKVQDIDEIFVYVDREVKYIEETNASIDYVHKDNIVKHSKNIIDLIEVGDIVKVLDIDWIRVMKLDDEDFLEALKEDIEIGDYKLLSIVTKEQFAQVEYKIEKV